MQSVILSAVIDATTDTLKLVPFLYLTYLLMEFLERKAGDKFSEKLAEVGRYGPIIGAAFGAIPQCGFSAAAASLYSGGVISVGTLIAVFLSTSDEMLPIFISEHVAPETILKILLTKIVIGLISGLALDFVLRFTRYRSKTEKRIHDLCEQDHCGCEEEEGNSFLAALKHTVNIIVFIFIIELILTIAVDVVGNDALAGFMGRIPVLGVFLAGLIGLIPNCGSSVVITQLYLQGLLGAGQMMAGLLVGAGVGLLVLFRTNRRHLSENIKIAVILYIFGVLWGLLIEATGFSFV
ncbi:MAG: putative manganese transporter [Eubacteriales bacterium]